MGEQITIPDEVKTIKAKEYCNWKGIEKVNLPNGLQSIGRKSFMGCESLSEINIYVHICVSNSF